MSTRPLTFPSALAVTLLALVPVPGLAGAQRLASGAAIAGQVADPTGAPLPGVTVVLRRPAVAESRTVTTDATGHYRFEDVEPGRYEITAMLAGFRPTRRELAVASSTVTVNLVLDLGALEDAVDVVGSRFAVSEAALRRIPGSIDVLDAERLELARVLTTSEALRKLPGLVAREEEGLGLRPNIAIRGLNPTRSTKTLLLEDGVPMAYAPYGDNASYYHAPIERFARIEVLKGSSQIAHGPVTVGGVINYLTPDPPLRTSSRLSLTTGSRGYVSGHAVFGGTWNETGLLFDLLRKQSEGARENQASDLRDATVKLQRQWSRAQTLTLKANYYGEDSQVGYSGLREEEYAANPRQNPFANDRFYGDRGGLSATHRLVLGRRTLLATTAYWQAFRRHWWRQSSHSGQRPNDAADPACGGMTNLHTTCGNEGRLRQYYVAGLEPRLQATYRLFGLDQDTEAGIRMHGEIQERRQENGDTPTARAGVLVEDNRRTTLAASWFVQQRVRIGRLTVSPGVRMERMAYTRANRVLDVSGHARLAQVVPGVGAAWTFGGGTTGFVGAHRGFAPPRVEDVISNTTGGLVDLAPEHSWNFEAGVRSTIRSGLAVGATVFSVEYENQIVPASLAGGAGATLTNGGATRHQGVEAASTVDLARLVGRMSGPYAHTAITWLPVAQFAGRRFSSVPGFTAVSVSGNRLPYAPALYGSVTTGFRHRSGFDFHVEAQHIGAQFSDDLNTTAASPDGQRGALPGYTLWNLALNWRAPRRDLTLFVAVKNVGNRTVIVDRSRGILPSMPRLIHVGIAVTLD